MVKQGPKIQTIQNLKILIADKLTDKKICQLPEDKIPEFTKINFNNKKSKAITIKTILITQNIWIIVDFMKILNLKCK